MLYELKLNFKLNKVIEYSPKGDCQKYWWCENKMVKIQECELVYPEYDEYNYWGKHFIPYLFYQIPTY